ncbi:MAG: amidohydrolase [Tissierellia bacterium]|nr:amidohydrolase [Tissierellia bacterium]
MKNIEELKEKLIAWRRDLHGIPEIGLHLPKTSGYIKKELEKMNVNYREYINANAPVAFVGQGRTIAFRTDMDALPILEETGLSFSAQGLAMHACGHDGHMALGLGLCAYFKSIEEQMDFRFVCIFQPGEEHPGGALPMIKEGVLSDFNIEAILGVHLGMIMNHKAGIASVKAGAIMAAADRFSIRIKGSGAHGALPNLGNDTILIASLIVSQLQYLISRELDPREPAVLSFGKISGGTSFNIMPGEVELEGTVRSLTEKSRKQIAGRIGELASQIAKSYGAQAVIDYNFRYPVVKNDAAMTKVFLKEAREFLGPERVILLESGTMVGEDMSYFLQEIPGVYFFFSTPKMVDGKCYPHHHPKFDLDEEYFVEATKLLAKNIVAFSRA